MIARSSLAAVIAIVVAAGAFACAGDQGTRSTPPPQLAPPPQTATLPPLPTFEIAKDLPPVRGNINAGAAPPEMVRAAYEFSARHPEVLKYVPCFCGCEQMGHKGNDDCFVSKRDGAGRVTEWETHGLICEVCILVANDSMRMFNSGASVSAIRTAIDSRYGGGRLRTPTPMPPKHGTANHQH